MRRAIAAALALVAALPAAASARESAADIARSLESDPVYVHPGAADTLTAPERGRVRIAIAERNIGRIKIAVVPKAVARAAGGEGELARRIAAGLELRGVLIVASTSDFFALTSYPDSQATVRALREALDPSPRAKLVRQLVAAVEAVARTDPGASADAGPAGSPPEPLSTPDVDGFLDDIGGAVRLGILIAALAAGIPFLVVAGIFVTREVRRRRRREEVEEWDESQARAELLALGEAIRALDIQTSLPGADSGAMAEYGQAIERYDQANELLVGDPTPHRVGQASAAIVAGHRHVEAARRRLDPV